MIKTFQMLTSNFGSEAKMKSMSWMGAIVAGAVLACVVNAREPFAEEPATLKITVGTSFPGIDSMPIYVARERGYFREEHVSVDLISLATGDKIAFALVGGSIDIARYTPDWIIRAIEKAGSKLKIVLGGNNNLVYSLVVSKDVQSYSDLKGKRIGVSTMASADAILAKKMLAAHGLGTADYVLIQAGSSPERAAALRAGSLAATVLTPPSDHKILDEGGVRRLDLSTNVVKRYAWGGESVREDWAHANRAALLAYMRAWIKATRWVHDPENKEPVIRILARELKIEDRYARTMYDIYLGPDALPVAKDGELDIMGFQALLKDMTEQGQIGPPIPAPEKYLDTSYWEEAERSLH
jgi:ABC-type nitrate/sulfonate/bicarbonate transport system substrate-binding protein